MRSNWCAAALIMLLAGAARAGEPSGAAFTDPKPPVVATPPDVAASKAESYDGLTFHEAPRALANGAATEDWPCFLGPNHNNFSGESKLLKDLGATPPRLVWEAAKGTGYAAPAVSAGRVILFHRVGDTEAIDCLEAETGKRFWRYAYSTSYQDRYGYCDGPRSSPAVADGMVFAIGAQGKVHCVRLADGQLVWQRDLMSEFKLTQNFFGVGASPLAEGGLLIVNVGAPHGPCVAAFNIKTGQMAWGAGDAWGPSYASPIPATLHGKRRVLVFAGGESRPPTGGLLCIDPSNGKLDFSFPWRGTRRESVNAASPVVMQNQIFVSECYGSGGAMLDVLADGSPKVAWTNPRFGMHFITAIPKDGFLYGVDGHGPEDADMVCVRQADGQEIWREHTRWIETISQTDGTPPRQVPVGTDRCSLLMVPGEGKCLCLGEYGHLLWLDLNPKGFNALSRTWLFAASDTWTPPVLSHGLLYVCQNQPGLLHAERPRLICYDMRAN